MAQKDDSSKAKQIKVLLSVLGTAALLGALLSIAMLYFYNPTGSYFAGKVLLDPDNAFTLRYVEPGNKPQLEKRYVFDRMLFSYVDPKSKKNLSANVPKEKYEQFYKKISADRSLTDITPEIEKMFYSSQPSVLILKVRQTGDDSSKMGESTFSKIDFAENGNYYRIQLRQAIDSQGWAYFEHAQILKEAIAIMGTINE